MTNFFKSLPLHLKSALRSIKRSFASALSSVFAVSVTLILIMLFLVTALNISSFTASVEDSVKIFARIDSVVEESNYASLQKQIEAIDHVQKVVYSSKEEEFTKFIANEQGGKQYEIFKDDNPLNAAFYIDATSAEFIEQVKNDVAKIDGIKDADYGGDSASKMIKAFDSLRIGGGIFVAALCILAIFLISNTIKTNIHNRREEIAIMRNVGASNWFIKTPFMMEGAIIGIIGAIVPIVVTIFGYQYLYTRMEGRFFTAMFQMQTPVPFSYLIALSLLGIGVIVGLIGSFMSVNKYLKWKR